MNAVVKPLEVRFEPLQPQWLDTVLSVEQRVYPHPWTRLNFADAVSSGYQSQLLMAGDTLLGYFVAMKGVDEVHLLNITVAPDYQRQGWSRVMLDALAVWPRGRVRSGCGWRCGWATSVRCRCTRAMAIAGWGSARTITLLVATSAKTRW